MKILITGGCGFVGAAIGRHLMAALGGAEITAFDSLRRRGSETNLTDLARHGIRVVHGDMRIAADVDALGSFDWVIDAAAEPSVLAGTSAGGHTGRRQLIDHNLLGTVNLLEAAARWEAGVVLLSTSRVYSIPALVTLPLTEQAGRGGPRFVIDPGGDLPSGVAAAGIDESFSTASPVSLYGATKLASETLAFEYAHAVGTPLVINRCGVLAGAGQFGRADQGIFSWWIHRWRSGRPLAYIGFGGRGLQVRDCLHADDLAQLVSLQMQTTGGTGPESRPTPLHVSGGGANSMSLAELSAWCGERFGPREVKGNAEPRPFDVPWLVLDHAQATATHGWRPTRSLISICEEIATHAERCPDWLDRCGG
jgi:CDP-paratose 2-epimerase